MPRAKKVDEKEISGKTAKVSKGKKTSERKEAWLRIVIGIIGAIIFSVWRYLIFLFGVLNWFIVVFSGKRNKELAMFSEYFNTEFYQFLEYMTFMSNKMPFPFSSIDRISKFS